MKNFNEMKHRIKLYRSTETINEEADRVKTYLLVDTVWAHLEIKPRYVVRDNATEQILTYNITIRKRPIDFDAVEIDGKRIIMKIPAYSDPVYTYINGEVLA